jgi:hypothetical protein
LFLEKGCRLKKLMHSLKQKNKGIFSKKTKEFSAGKTLKRGILDC